MITYLANDAIIVNKVCTAALKSGLALQTGLSIHKGQSQVVTIIKSEKNSTVR